jgi:UDP-N-acetyl-D-glucosamine dehydrogenase
MPAYVVSRVAEVLNSKEKPVRGSRILIMGLAYKANVDDMRESPSFKLMDLLTAQGAKVDYYDPHIPVIGPTREHAEWTGTRSIAWNEQTVSSYDVVLIATHHSRFNLEEAASWARVIVDTRNSMTKVNTRAGLVVKA